MTSKRVLGCKSNFVFVGCQYGSEIDGRLWKSGSTKQDDLGLSQSEVPGVFEDGGRSARIQQDHANPLSRLDNFVLYKLKKKIKHFI